MKRSLALLLTLVMSLGLLAGCGSKDTTADEPQQDGESGAKQIETLKVAFVPSREPQEIITATEPLKQLLKDELAKEGYEVGEVEITVGTTYEAVGEGLEAGTIDVGLIPGGTYVLYDDGAEVILTATRNGLSKDSDNAKDWNDGQPTEASEKQAVSYRALIIAGPSDKGQELAAKVNGGEDAGPAGNAGRAPPPHDAAGLRPEADGVAARKTGAARRPRMKNCWKIMNTQKGRTAP